MLKGRQIAVIAAAVVLVAILYLAPRKVVEKEQSLADTEKALPKEDIKPFIDSKLAQLDAQQKALVNELLKRLTSADARSKEALTDSLAGLLDVDRLPVVAAYYYELLSLSNSSEKHWLNAAYRYFDSFKTETDSIYHKVLLDKAITCYRKVVEINPANLDAKTDLGVCYTETSQPMQEFSCCAM